MQTFCRSGGIAHTSLTSAPEGGELSALRSGCFIPRGRPWYPLDGRLCGAPEPVWMYWFIRKNPFPASARN